MTQKAKENPLSTGLISSFPPFLNITSPRSLEACRRQGIDPHELLVRSAAEIKEMFRSKNLDKDGVEQMAIHHEERRREKIRVLIEERAVLVEDEKNGYLNFTGTKVRLLVEGRSLIKNRRKRSLKE